MTRTSTTCCTLAPQSTHEPGCRRWGWVLVAGTRFQFHRVGRARMSLYAELHANGQFGEVGCNRLFELARQELRLFPDLRAATSDDAVIWGYVAEFLIGRGA